MDYVYYDDETDGQHFYNQLHRQHDAASDLYNYDEDDYYGDMADHQNLFESKSKLEQIVVAIETCVVPSLGQLLRYISLLLLCCLVFRLMCWLVRKLRKHYSTNIEIIMHISSFTCGLVLLYMTMGKMFFIVLSLSVFSYLVMICLLKYSSYLRQHIGSTMAFVTISGQFLYELSWRQPDAWHRIRGVQMIINMKVISLAFDIEETLDTEMKQIIPSFTEYLGYMFCPASCVLGPWIPFNAYLHSLRAPAASKNINAKWSWILCTILNVTLSLGFLSISNCFVPLISIGSKNNVLISPLWERNYAEALGVRCSQYFISFLSQAGMSAAGLMMHVDRTPNAYLGHMITKPWFIEFPQSLSTLVRNWNIPMHDWLKKYIYSAAMQRFGNNYFVAIFATYLVSSLLHGMHLRIYLVLLTLGFFSYVETAIRSKLAQSFDACIQTNSCRKPCNYEYCPNSRGMWKPRMWIVVIVNICFSLLTIFNLAYLGVMLGENDTDNANNSKQSLLRRWQEVDYINHYIALGMFIFYLFIS